MDSIKLKARAKINLTLDITGKRDDGYHLVEMVMQQIDLFDEVRIARRSGKGINLKTNLPYLPLDESNSAYKAAMLMMDEFRIEGGVDIFIDKRIPVSAGLAGGSTDAAAVIVGMDKLFSLDAGQERLMEIGLMVGADVPFCILARTAVARGIGEKLEPVAGLERMWIVLSKPSIGVSTREIYSHYNINDERRHPDTAGMVSAIESRDFYSIMGNLRNVLEDVTLERYPVVSRLKDKFREFGAKAVLMSGSGPTVFAVYNDKERASSAYKNLSRLYKQTYIVETYNGGWEFEVI